MQGRKKIKACQHALTCNKKNVFCTCCSCALALFGLLRLYRLMCTQSRLANGLPERIDDYFSEKPARRLLWFGISGFSGFYVANTVSLSFGALAVNDVAAAAACVFFYELTSRKFYGAENKCVLDVASVWLRFPMMLNTSGTLRAKPYTCSRPKHDTMSMPLTLMYARRTFTLWLLQWFKLGFTYALLADACKLGG